MELKHRSNRRFQEAVDNETKETKETKAEEDNTTDDPGKIAEEGDFEEHKKDDLSDNKKDPKESEDDESEKDDDKKDDSKPKESKKDDKPKEEPASKEDDEFQSDDDEGFPDIPQYMQDRIGGTEGNVDDFDLPTDDADLGNDTDGQNNDYNEKDIEILNKSISEELAASSFHTNNILEVSSEVLKKLYADISDEERFHAEQFLYAKSLITGEKYEPQDPDVKSEYEELVNGGMNEDDALNTVADRMRLTSGSKAIDEDDDFDFSDIDSQLEMLETAIHQTSTLYDFYCEQYSKGEVDEGLRILFETYVNTDGIVMEASNVVSPGKAGGNPFKMLYDLIKGIWSLFKNLVLAIKRMLAKSGQKTRNRLAWIKKHGFGAIFSEGVHFIFWNIKNNSPAVGDVATFTHILMSLARDISINTFGNENNPFRDKLIQMINENNKDVSKTIYVDGNINRGIETLKNINLDKTKVVINDNNRADMINYLFTQNAAMLKLLYSGSTQLAKLIGIIGEMINKGQQAYGQPGVDINPEKFNANIKNFQTVIKYCNVIAKACAHDTKVLLKIYDNLDTQIQDGTVEGIAAKNVVTPHRAKVDADEAAAEAKKNAAPDTNGRPGRQFTPATP